LLRRSLACAARLPPTLCCLSFTSTFFPELPEGGYGPTSGNKRPIFGPASFQTYELAVPTPKSPRDGVGKEPMPVFHDWMFTTLLTLLTEEAKSGDAIATLRVGPTEASPVPSPSSLSCAASVSLSRVRHSSVEAGHALPGRTKVPSGAGPLLLQPEAGSVLHGRITTRKSRRVVPKAQPACPYR
jgi:hypothetical protein